MCSLEAKPRSTSSNVWDPFEFISGDRDNSEVLGLLPTPHVSIMFPKVVVLTGAGSVDVIDTSDGTCERVATGVLHFRGNTWPPSPPLPTGNVFTRPANLHQGMPFTNEAKKYRCRVNHRSRRFWEGLPTEICARVQRPVHLLLQDIAEGTAATPYLCWPVTLHHRSWFCGHTSEPRLWVPAVDPGGTVSFV